jgi:hypothetical protein
MKYSDLIKRVEELKIDKKRFSDIKIYFNETAIFTAGLLDGKGNVRGCDSKNSINVFIATEKGYLSSEWKKTDFFKMGRVELTEELFNELLPFIQDNTPKVYIRNTGVSKASVIANFITKTGGDIYCNA